MGRKTRMPRLPPILGKGAAHKDRRREAQDNWLQHQIDLAQQQLDSLPDHLAKNIYEYRGPSHLMGTKVIVAIVDNPNAEQEDNDA